MEAYVWRRMAELWTTAVPRNYARAIKPFLLCSNPKSLDRALLADLKQYAAGEKLDGDRVMLLADTLNGKPFVISISRNGVMKPLEGATCHHSSLFSGTLIDGELLDTGYVAFDIVALSGLSLWQNMHDQRMRALNTAVPLMRIPDIPITVKPWLPLSKLSTLPATEGLVFVSLKEPMLPGAHAGLLKWKRQHTLDLVVTPEGVVLVLDAKGALQALPHGKIRVSQCSVVGSGVVECAMSKDGGQWIATPIRMRPDKAGPNEARVVDHTLRQIEENVTLAELHALASA
jgi:hypothetical protein